MNPMARLIQNRTFASLYKHRNYRLFFLGNVVSLAGNWLQNTAQAWLVLQLTHSAQAVGILSIALFGPYVVLGLFGGALSDRFDHRRTLLWTQTALMACAGLLAALVLLHIITIWEIDAIAAIRSFVLVFNSPSRQAFLIQLVGREELANAIGLNASVVNIARIIGPGIAGILIVFVGIGMCFALNAASYLGVIVALLIMRISDLYPIHQVQREELPILYGTWEGLRYVWRMPQAFVVFMMLLIIATVSINFNVLVPVLAAQTLHSGPEIYGLLSTSLGMGALLGALISASLGRTTWSMLFIGASGLGILEVLLAPQHAVIVCAVLLVLVGICQTLYTFASNAIVQLAAPNHLLGRIAGLYSYIVLGIGPLGDVLAGWLSQQGGTQFAFFIAGSVGILVAGSGYVYFRLKIGRLSSMTTFSEKNN